ncbi:MAG: hypothetical protein K8S27_01930 [Candidatus Omnitrophica bacterium]|nr:hypothetical protein [Candidatus Omnitrophota bacterium]
MKKDGLTRWLDFILLSCVIVFITWQPFYLHGTLNTFEHGLYLPGIQGILDGKMPYRDFMYLRGPFELYVPAFMMMVAGRNVAVLATYFYAGTVLTLLMCLLIAREVLDRRWLLALFVFVLTARTFPRVVFTYWGGLRYVWGLLSVWFLIKFFKSYKKSWLFFCGITTAIAFWTSIEMGFCSGMMAGLSLVIIAGLSRLKESDHKPKIPLISGFVVFGGAVLVLSVPYAIYLMANGALIPFIDNVLTIVTRLNQTFPQTDLVPLNLGDVLLGMLSPASKNFRHLTPIYTYLIMAGYLYIRARLRRWQTQDSCVLVIWIYGALLYATSFRNLWASQFEMALQPEKILLFCLIHLLIDFLLRCRDDLRTNLQPEQVSRLNWWKKRLGLGLIYFYLVSVIMSSIIYPFVRFSRRFTSIKYVFCLLKGEDPAQLSPLRDQQQKKLAIPPLKGLTVPAWQADDFYEIYDFVQKNVPVDEPVLFYPEMAAYYFIVDRPYLSRFPMGTFPWFNERWYGDFKCALIGQKPRYAIFPKELPDYFDKQHFTVEANRVKYSETMDFIRTNYKPIKKTHSFVIWENI